MDLVKVKLYFLLDITQIWISSKGSDKNQGRTIIEETQLIGSDTHVEIEDSSSKTSILYSCCFRQIVKFYGLTIENQGFSDTTQN